MNPLLYSIPTLLTGLLAIASREFKPETYYYTKALPVLWILALYTAALAGAPSATSLHWLIFWGLALGIAGDVFLLFKKWFIPGFIAFASGHVLYLIAFLQAPGPLAWVAVAALCVPGLVYALVLWRRTTAPRMLPLVWLYIVLISAMTIAAWNADLVEGRPGWFAAGATLFYFSDACWSWNRFVQPLPRPAIWILGTYYSGQALIVWGAITSLVL